MRVLRGATWMITLALALVVATSARAIALNDDGPCPPGDLNCVGVGVGAPGGHGSPGTGEPVAGGPVTQDPCAQYTGYAYSTCSAGMPTRQAGICNDLYAQYYSTLTTGQLNAVLSGNGCPTVADALPPSPATLAVQAEASFRLPNPSGARSPLQTLEYREHPFTWVNLWTYFWTDPATWTTFTATARAGGAWATVTATPVLLSFDPGDGSAPVSCAGPGRPWLDADGDSAPSQGACGYRYRTVTGPGYDHPFTSTQTITWRLTWTGSGDTSGSLTSRTTSTVEQLNVLQIQVVTR